LVTVKSIADLHVSLDVVPVWTSIVVISVTHWVIIVSPSHLKRFASAKKKNMEVV
jgi:hypothetical protein